MMRTRTILLSGTMLLLLASLAAAAWLDNEANRGVTFEPPAEPIPWTGVGQGGVNVFNLHLEPDPAVVTRTLTLARDMGAHFVRMQLPWEDIEIHARGDFTDRRNDVDGDGRVDTIDAWAKYDRIVDTAVALDLELVLRIDRPPAWARERGNATAAWQAGLAENSNSTGPPDDFSDLARFAGLLAERYRDRVRFYQVWNEPNLVYEWGWERPDPARYVELLRVTSAAIRAAAPRAVIIFPSLSPTDGRDRLAPINDLEFLDQAYRAGAAPAFDIMSAQAYALGQPPDENRYVFVRNPLNQFERDLLRPIDTRVDVSRVVLLREVMERHGDTATPVWIGEFGYVSDTPAGYPQNWGPPVSAEQQAEYLVGQLARARREWPWVGVMHVWMLRWNGPPPQPGDPTPYFALVERDWTPRPAYTAIRDYLAQPVAGVGTHAWAHPAVTRTRTGWQLRFAGTRLALVGAPATGFEAVSIDDNPTTLVSGTVHGRPALLLAAPLADGAHTLEIRYAGSDQPVQFVVARDVPLPWLWAPLVGVPVLGLMVCSAVLWSAGRRRLDRVERGSHA